jgi:hypothetical protein
VQAYNGQLSGDGDHQIIVAAELSNQAPGVGSFIHLIDLVPSNCEQTPKAALTAAGYFADANVRRAHAAEGCNNEPGPPLVSAEGGLRLQSSQPEEAHRQSQ